MKTRAEYNNRSRAPSDISTRPHLHDEAAHWEDIIRIASRLQEYEP